MKRFSVLLDVFNALLNLLLVSSDILLLFSIYSLLERELYLVRLNLLLVLRKSQHVGSDLLCSGMQASLDQLGRFQVVAIDGDRFPLNTSRYSMPSFFVHNLLVSLFLNSVEGFCHTASTGTSLCIPVQTG